MHIIVVFVILLIQRNKSKLKIWISVKILKLMSHNLEKYFYFEKLILKNKEFTLSDAIVLNWRPFLSNDI